MDGPHQHDVGPDGPLPSLPAQHQTSQHPPVQKQIVVTALYDYVGQDDASLTFREGDIIQVLTRLPSGWWDGICRGQRGWFPSNYVSKPTLLQPSINVNVQQYDLSAPVQQEYSPAPSSSTNASSQQRLRISTHSHRSADSSNISSPGGFVPHPRNARSPTPTGQRTDLPPNWGSKTAPDGRIYYYNLVTDETRWTLPVFDPRASDQQQDQQQRQGQEDASASIATALAQLNLDAPPEWTWPGLSARIFSCVEALAQATSSSRKERYVPLASAIIDSIRTMLYATDTAKKDSPAIVANKVLRSYHRQILSALSKLVLAAKTASAVWPPPDAMHVLNQIAGDVLLGVRNFSTTAQELGLPVHAIAISGSGQQPQPQDATASAPVSAPAKVASIAGDAAHDHDGQHTNTELLAFLEGSTNRTIELMKTIADPARLLAFQDNGKPASAATGPVDVAKQQMTLISAVRSIVQEVGNFLESVDDLPLDSLSDDITVDFKVNRLALYNSISSLVMSTQLATNAVTASNAHREIVTAARLVENAIKDLLIATKFLIEEKETMEQVTLQTYIEQYGNNGQGGNRPPSGDMQGRQRNAMSMGAYQSSVPGPNSAAAVSIPGGRAGNNSSPTPEMAYSPGQTGDWDDEAFNISKRSSKLRQILGQEVAPIIRAKPDTPWYMQYDYGPNDIILNMEGQIRGATLRALVEKLTLHDSVDANFTLRFLLTYKSFTNSVELVQLLEERFMIQAPTQPRELTPAELKEWHDLKLTPIRLRVFNVIKSWIENYLGGDAEDLQALDLAREFADTKMKKYLPTASAQLLRLIDRRRENGPNAVTRLLTANNRDFPSPILPKNIRRFRFLDLDPLELARQLTLLESELFASIQPSEFLSKAWSAEKGRPSTFVHVNALISLSNNISSWVAATILGEPDLRKRAKTMSQFITIAEKCSMLNNYNGLVSILGSLDSAHIHRLKKTWEQVPGRQLAIYDQLRDIMSPTRNFSNYRTALRSVNPPCVPFLGCYLTDLTFIADGNPDVIKGRSNLINFGKMAKTADVLREVQQFQHVKYTLIKVPEIQDFLESVLVDDSSVSEFYDMSLQLEPRNDSPANTPRVPVTDDERSNSLRSLLQESGFLE